MIKRLIISSFIFIAFLSCDEGMTKRVVTCDQPEEYEYLDHYPSDQICHSDTCNVYFDVWKTLFLEKNNLTENFFEEHITVSRTSLNSWNKGISFRICYDLNIEWATAYTCDSFIIIISENINRLSTLPRNTFLTKDQIELVIDNRSFSSSIDTVSSFDDLQFQTFDSALETLISKAQVNTLCGDRIFINDENGNLTMETNGKYKNGFNSCIQGTIDLITGITETRDEPCWVN